jgi:drug/metabolite transporter (DMT)-like permease
MIERKFSSTDFSLLCVALIWGNVYIFGKIALREFDPVSFAALRTVLAAPILLLALIFKENGLRFGKKDIIPFALLGFLGHFLNRLCFSYGLNYTSASSASILMSATPVFAALFGVFLRIDKVSPRSVFGILTAFVGVFLVIKGDWSHIELSSVTLKGDFFILGATVSWALFTVLTKRILKEHTSLRLTTWTAFFGAVFMMPFLIKPLAQNAFVEPSLKAWLCLLYVSIMANALAQLLWVTGIQKIGPTKTTVYICLVPLVAIFFAGVILMESILPIQFLGVLLVLAGVYLTRFG